MLDIQKEFYKHLKSNTPWTESAIKYSRLAVRFMTKGSLGIGVIAWPEATRRYGKAGERRTIRPGKLREKLNGRIAKGRPLKELDDGRLAGPAVAREGLREGGGSTGLSAERGPAQGLQDVGGHVAPSLSREAARSDGRNCHGPAPIARSGRQAPGVGGHELPVARDDLIVRAARHQGLAASIAATTFSPTIVTISAWASAPPQAMRTGRSSMTLCASTASRNAAKKGFGTGPPARVVRPIAREARRPCRGTATQRAGGAGPKDPLGWGNAVLGTTRLRAQAQRRAKSVRKGFVPYQPSNENLAWESCR